MNVNTSAVTNSSITLSWEYPPPPFQPIQNFLVSTTKSYCLPNSMIEYHHKGDLLWCGGVEKSRWLFDSI